MRKKRFSGRLILCNMRHHSNDTIIKAQRVLDRWQVELDADLFATYQQLADEFTIASLIE